MDAQGFVQKGAVEAFEESVALGTAHPGGAVVGFGEWKERLGGVPAGADAELPPTIVREDRLDGPGVGFEEGRDVVVEPVDGGEEDLGGGVRRGGPWRAPVSGRFHQKEPSR